ncbi:MAG: response regulator [Geminicoccaceae bacterium]
MPNVPVISIIDDDESVRVALASLVRSLGYAVRTFTGAGEFLQLGRVDDIACLIVDVQMPGMGGLELQELLVARNMRLPTIFITAYPEDRVRDRALAGGAIGFLSKPFAAQDLIHCIDSALRPTDGLSPR